MRRWIATAITGYLAGALSMLVLGTATLWFVYRATVPASVNGVVQAVRYVLAPLALEGALWAGVSSAVAALLIDWMFGRLSDWAAWLLFTALFLILQRLHGVSIPLGSVELTLLFAVVWALCTWLLARGMAAMAKRMHRRKK